MSRSIFSIPEISLSEYRACYDPNEDDCLMGSSLAERLREAREAAGLMQIEVADRLKIPRSTYAGYEAPSKKNEPDAETLVRIAELLGVTTDYLLSGRPSIVATTINEVHEARAEYVTIPENDPEVIQNVRELHRMLRGLSPMDRQDILDHARFVVWKTRQKSTKDGK